MVDLAFGGREEGGWYYETGELVRTHRMFRSKEAAYAYRERLQDKLDATLNKGRREISSVLSEGQYRALAFADTAPQHFPEHRPHYE
jgi:hypothetical protein